MIKRCLLQYNAQKKIAVRLFNEIKVDLSKTLLTLLYQSLLKKKMNTKFAARVCRWSLRNDKFQWKTFAKSIKRKLTVQC